MAYPSSMAQADTVKSLISDLSKDNLVTTLTTFSEFYNRYYTSSYGKEASDWLFSQVQDLISASGATKASAKQFAHSWTQSSIIATIPGKSTDKIVVGAHLDSVNGRNRTGRSPGAGKLFSASRITYLESIGRQAATR